jgi:isoleucyl-tRNA synthetase
MSNKSDKLTEVSPRQDFVEMEKRILKTWYDDGIVDKYLTKNKEAEKNFSFIDGPITANNPMGVHHAWGRTYKDIVQRYKNAQGFEQRFQNGFDCQGLWVEVQVEKALGMNSKMDIEEYGLDNFTNACVSRVNKYAGIQTEQSKRLGMFMDWDNSYYTMSEDNNLAIWHFLKKVKERDLLYKNKSATTWCPRCETGLSQHELSEGYKDVVDKAVFVLFKLKGADNEYALVWTTTPWTLAANVMISVNSALEYVKAQYEGKTVFVGKEAAKKLGLNDVEDFDVKELLGREYESLFDDIDVQKDLPHSIVEWDLVAADSGSAMVHMAPGCGQDDFLLGEELGMPKPSPLDTAGKFTEGYGDLTGKYAHDVADEVFEYLDKKGVLFKVEEYKHSYPHCWRCKTKCLFRLEDNWFINIDKLRVEMKEQADTVEWSPEFVGKRMQDWLDNMGDWMISRKRYYGLSLPFYECTECNELHVVGSKEELKEMAVNPEKVDELPSLHRPWIDDIKIKCTKCSAEVERVLDVGDCWLDAGVVPFSTLKYMTDKDYWNKWFQADFITEMMEQVRLWFYSMLVFGVVLEHKVPYKYVVGSGEMRDEKNERMAKTKPNYVEFNMAADKVGTDLIRWNFSTASLGANMKFGWPTLENVRRQFYLPLWNSYSYLAMYAKMHNWDPSTYSPEKTTKLMDKWLIARTKKLTNTYEQQMDKFNIPFAAREIEAYVQDLSTWYIRSSRDRFRDGDGDAIGTLHYAFVELSKLLAPMLPYVSEEMYQNLVVNLDLDGAMQSVHLEDFVALEVTPDDEKVLNEMESARAVVKMGLKIRDENRLKIRQPLAKVYVQFDSEDLQNIVKGELKVKEVEFSKEAVKEKGFVTVENGSMYIALQTELTPELKAEGLSNEFTRHAQVLRKKSGLKMGEEIDVKYSTDSDEVEAAVKEYTDSISQTISAKSIERADKVTPTLDKSVKVGEAEVEIELIK